jgi:hypothetical protein
MSFVRTASCLFLLGSSLAAPAAAQARLEDMEPTFKSYSKPAFEALREARKIAATIREAKDYPVFQRAERELAGALGRLREMKTWSCAAECPTLRELENLYRRVRQEVDVAAEPILVERLANVACPADVYEGADREKLRTEILAEWKKTWPDDEVLAVRFPMEKAIRTKEKTWREADQTWVFTDTSVLRVSVIVKRTAKVASIYPAYVNTDHLSETVNYGVSTKTGGFVVQEMLVANVAAK